MQTLTKPYRVAKTSNGRTDGAFALTPTLYGVRADAENWIARQATGFFESSYILIEPAEVKATVAIIKARHLMDFLKGRRVDVASDYDDARGRLLKLADIADKEFTRNRVNGPRKGYLKTEAGLAAMYEMMLCMSERRRVVSASLTPAEQARQPELERAGHRRIRDALAQEFDAEFRARAIELTTASLHADEY